jgi:hypothetical protein
MLHDAAQATADEDGTPLGHAATDLEGYIGE